MDQNFTVILLALFMFVVTFLFGYLPTKITTSQRLMNLIAIFGAGLLVGAALIVIVPEGMLVLFNALSDQDEDLTSVNDAVAILAQIQRQN
jgi:zinc transporter 9